MKEKPLIYVIDDIVDTAELLAHYLDMNDYATRIFLSGEQALKVLENHDQSQPLPELILLDLMMPGIDGIEVVRRIRANSNLGFIPIIMTTASIDSQDRILGLQTGADDFLTKPVHRAELLARVRSLIRLKQAYDEKADLLAKVQQAYDDLAAAQDQLISTAERKAQVETMMATAGGICHEMSQPLTSALLTLQLIKTSEALKHPEDLDTVETSLLKARVILDRLRALTRYETVDYLDGKRILDIQSSSETLLGGNDDSEDDDFMGRYP